ncbi:hypothetical protein OF66_0951 [Seleniivibrio woodruffii]|uniref:Uncharacterized protein n=2 Tax=Seleniivibrio woodruffii TaxID=1078050 RepID=A0A4V2PS66_9BACT|nr:hypothetical protein [Seleniivibrio woodruffii]TCK61541.1 hypothetical protein C8D98_0042 [Seleniivibrio woodruffii]TVZ35344.1 hypothetical protein OF66_0951 [Seleniivibrio woodruffii]
MIPNFNSNYLLPEGIHECSGLEFIDFFCFNDYRESFRKSIADIFDWATESGAIFIIFGGSFVTKAHEPNDIDCLIVFRDDTNLPRRNEMLTIDAMKIDIQVCSIKYPNVIDSFLHLFMTKASGEKVGVIQVNLTSTNKTWEIKHYPSDIEYEIIQRAYIGRHFIDHYDSNGVIVTIHGLMTDAKWNNDLAPLISSKNWIFAPYSYTEDNGIDLLRNKKKRDKVVDEFREWLFALNGIYKKPISIIAHSFGTYIIAAYISGFKDTPPVSLNCLILTGSIITTNFDWNIYRGTHVARVLNEKSPKDEYVKWMPTIDWLTKDALFGTSGVDGFIHKSEILLETDNNIFKHNNVIKKDVIEGYWLPYLYLNKDIWYTEFIKNRKRNKQDI